jgi:hypothetical protein
VAAAAELVGALQVIAELPQSDCGPVQRDIYFVLRNRFEMHLNFHDALVSGVVMCRVLGVGGALTRLAHPHRAGQHGGLVHPRVL